MSPHTSHAPITAPVNTIVESHSARDRQHRPVVWHAAIVAVLVGVGMVCWMAPSRTSAADQASGEARPVNMASTAPALPAKGVAFTSEDVKTRAYELSLKPFSTPQKVFPLAKTYDEHRAIRLRPGHSYWRQPGAIGELHPLPTGWLFNYPVELHVVENNVALTVALRGSMFDATHPAPPLNADTVVPVSGFKLTGPLNDPTKSDELIVFQGASYFRSLASGQLYGASARGLAINTAQAGGEEFPAFRAFWVERPKTTDRHVIVHALLDSPSVTGAYTFTVRPGKNTEIDVKATLFPRVAVSHVGLGALTSMHLLSPMVQRPISDYRPRIHDSSGLAIMNGAGERIWRPLTNPRRLEVSSFSDDNPRGFGLEQREREHRDYQDTEANYERRPSVWVEPLTQWGRGAVVLVEIPTDEEIHDNIVAFWRPETPWQPNRSYQFDYRLTWLDHVPTIKSGEFVQRSAVGLAHGQPQGGQQIRFVVDYSAPMVPVANTTPQARVTASAGKLLDVRSTKHPITGGTRVAFLFDPQGATAAEFRLNFEGEVNKAAEMWLYRWTRVD
jgi:periplasmic glucans biosynthesis protein